MNPIRKEITRTLAGKDNGNNVHCLCVSGTVLGALLSTLNREVSNPAKIASLRKGGVRIQSKVNETQKPIQILSTSPAGVTMCVCALSWALMIPVLSFLLFFLLFILRLLLSIAPLFFFPISNSDLSPFLFFSDASPHPPCFSPRPYPSPSNIFDLFVSLMRTWDLSYDLQGYLR